jgi:Gpi18-like mannosyltransferase
VIGLLVPLHFTWARSGTPGLPTAAELRGAFLRWDSPHYADIATSGYATSLDFHDAFLPGYPLLLKAATALIPDVVLAGLAVSAIFEFIALYYFALLVRGERDLDAARFCVWCLAVSPFAFFLTALYTEGPFIAGAAASLYHARRGDTLRASLSATFACAMRVTGLALVPAVLIEHLWRSR